MVSVIIVCATNRGRDSIFETLASFPWASSVPHEVIVVDQAAPGRSDRYLKDFPALILLECPHLPSIPKGRNLAIAASSGSILAFVDDHIRFPANYLDQLTKTFSGDVDVAGGSVANANPQTSGSWAHYFVEYSKWLAGIPNPDQHDLPGSNWAVRRELVRELGAFPDAAFGFETTLIAALARQGKRVVHVPTLIIGHLHETRIRDFWPISFHYGKHFAQSLPLSRPLHILRAAAFPLIAAVLYWRAFNKARQQSAYLQRFLLVSPQVAFTLFIRCLGEAVGHLSAPATPAAPAPLPPA